MKTRKNADEMISQLLGDNSNLAHNNAQIKCRVESLDVENGALLQRMQKDQQVSNVINQQIMVTADGIMKKAPDIENDIIKTRNNADELGVRKREM